MILGPGSFQQRSKRPPRALQEVSKSSRGSKLRPKGLRGPIVPPPEALRTSKIANIVIKFACFERAPRVFQEQSKRYQTYFTTCISIELLGQSLQRFLRQPHKILATEECEHNTYPHTDVLTENSQDPHRNLPESLHYYTETLQHP